MGREKPFADNSYVLFKRKHSKTLNIVLPSVFYCDSQTCLALQVKQIPPVLGQFPLTTLEEKVNKFTAWIRIVWEARLTQNDEWSEVHYPLQNGDWWEVKWSLDLWVGFKALFCSHSSGTSRGLTHIEGHRIPMMRLMCCITTRAGT